jgi:hypothetical protein
VCGDGCIFCFPTAKCAIRLFSMISIPKRFIFGTPFGHIVIGEDHIPYFVKKDCFLAEEQKIK